MTSLTSDFRPRCAYKTVRRALPLFRLALFLFLQAPHPRRHSFRRRSTALLHEALATEFAEAASDLFSQRDLQKVMTKIFLAVLAAPPLPQGSRRPHLHGANHLARPARRRRKRQDRNGNRQSRPRTTKVRTLRRPLRRNGQTPRRNNPPHPRAKFEATHVVAGLQTGRSWVVRGRRVKKAKEEWRENS
jgi:hypothetical protein